MYPVNRPLSGSEDDDDVDRELMELENRPDTTSSLNSTLNTSSDIADCAGVKISRTQTVKTVTYHPNGYIQQSNIQKISEKISLPKKVDEPKGNSNLVVVGVIVSVVVLAAVAFIYHTNRPPLVVNGMNRPLLRCSFEDSVLDFPKQDKMLWKSLRISIESVLNDIPTRPSIFLLAYEDLASANKITRSIVERTTECMDSKVNALVLRPDDLAHNEMQKDYGVVITKYQNQLQKSGVMLVHDLNKVRGATCLEHSK